MDRKRLERGLVQVYTGEGKSKTMAALGLALRAVGHGLKVLLVRFLPDEEVDDIQAVQLFGNRFQVRQAGLNEMLRQGEATPSASRRAEEVLASLQPILQEGDFDVVILEQINAAMKLKLLQVAKVLEVITRRAPHVEVVLTGPDAPLELIAAADLVTEMVDLKG